MRFVADVVAILYVIGGLILFRTFLSICYKSWRMGYYEEYTKREWAEGFLVISATTILWPAVGLFRMYEELNLPGMDERYQNFLQDSKEE